MLVNVVEGMWSGFRAIGIKVVIVVWMLDRVFLGIFMKIGGINCDFACVSNSVVFLFLKYSQIKTSEGVFR